MYVGNCLVNLIAFAPTPDTGSPRLTQAKMSLYWWCINSLTATTPPTTTCCRKETLSKMLRHKSVNNWIDTAAEINVTNIIIILY